MRRKTEEEAVLYYHLKGLTAWEIAKLLDLSERKVQRLKRCANLRIKAKLTKAEDTAAALYRQGLTYVEIGKRLGKSRQTIYNYLNKAGVIRKKAAI